MNRRITGVLLAIAILVPLAALAQDAAVTASGEVIDSACFIKQGAKGEAHAECATRCADSGIPLALHEDETGQVIWFTSTSHGDATEMLKPFAGKHVTVTGKRYERDGAVLMELESVDAE